MSTAQEAPERHQFIPRISMFDVAGCEEFCRQCGQFANAEIHTAEPQPATPEGEGDCERSHFDLDRGEACPRCDKVIERDNQGQEMPAQPTTPHTATAIGNLLDIVSFAENATDRANAKAEIIAAHAALVEAIRLAALKLHMMTKADGSFQTTGTEVRAVRDDLYAAFILAEPDAALAGK